jgi:hypothetical protein
MQFTDAYGQLEGVASDISSGVDKAIGSAQG